MITNPGKQGKDLSNSMKSTGILSDHFSGAFGDVATPDTPTSLLRNRPVVSGGLLKTSHQQSCKKGGVDLLGFKGAFAS